MIYAVSDIHGCYGQYQNLLDKLHLKENDTLYVLGDVIDRGPDGFKILCDMASRPNVVNLMGNHEAMAMDALPGILQIMTDSQGSLNRVERNNISLWFHNGGEESLRDFLQLGEAQRKTAWEYLCAMPSYREVETGGRRFVLVHGGLPDFSPSRPLDSYHSEELLWCRPEPDTVYFPDRCVVLGHTPTQFLYDSVGQPEPCGKIFWTDTFIDIDCGCVYPGGRLGCLCLDTMEDLYI